MERNCKWCDVSIQDTEIWKMHLLDDDDHNRNANKLFEFGKPMEPGYYITKNGNIPGFTTKNLLEFFLERSEVFDLFQVSCGDGQIVIIIRVIWKPDFRDDRDTLEYDIIGSNNAIVPIILYRYDTISHEEFQTIMSSKEDKALVQRLGSKSEDMDGTNKIIDHPIPQHRDHHCKKDAEKSLVKMSPKELLDLSSKSHGMDISSVYWMTPSTSTSCDNPKDNKCKVVGGISAKELLLKMNSNPLENNYISTSVDLLDKFIDGGIQLGKLTTIYGDVGTGKSTLCLQLCLNVQRNHVIDDDDDESVRKESLYIDTESSFSVNRLRDMSKALLQEFSKNECLSSSKGMSLTPDMLMNRIHVIKCKSLQDLKKYLKALDKYLKTNPKIKLVVLDSIAYPLYTIDAGFDGRTREFYEIGQVLHSLAAKYNVAVVVTNNITTSFVKDGQASMVEFLGDNWKYIPNTIIYLSIEQLNRDLKVVSKNDSSTKTHVLFIPQVIRKALIEKSSTANNKSVVFFSIIEAGIRNAYASC